MTAVAATATDLVERHLSVSILEGFRRFRDGLCGEDDFIRDLTTPLEQSEKMAAGEEFHRLIERLGGSVSHPEYRLIDRDRCLAFLSEEPPELAGVPEAWISGDMGGHRIAARCDLINGLEITDWKCTWSGFDAEKYMNSYQWRLYLALSGSERFRYVVYEMSSAWPTYPRSCKTLELMQYPTMETDCQQLVSGFLSWLTMAQARGLGFALKLRAIEY